MAKKNAKVDDSPVVEAFQGKKRGRKKSLATLAEKISKLETQVASLQEKERELDDAREEYRVLAANTTPDDIRAELERAAAKQRELEALLARMN